MPLSEAPVPFPTLPGKTGDPVKRGEDPRLLTGAGSYIGDLPLPGALNLVFVRSPHAHARIVGIDTSAAEAAPGVHRVLSYTDVADVLYGALPGSTANPRLQNPHLAQRTLLAHDKVRYVGEPVVAIVAETVEQGMDAADLVGVEYEQLPAVVDPEAALQPDAPLLFEDFGTNLAHYTSSSGGDVDAAFARADRVIRLKVVNQRLAPLPMEPRGAAAMYQPALGQLTVWASTQTPHSLRSRLSELLNVAENRVRVIAPDVGGGFGAKLETNAEEVLAAWLAMQMGTPVRWIERRTENFQAMIQGRGQIDDVEAAVSASGEILGLKVHAIADLGGGLLTLTSGLATFTALVLPGTYKIPAVFHELRSVYTNKTPVGAYRGAGRPEGAFLMERIVDKVARDLHLDPADVRRTNFIPADAFPYKTPLGSTYDSGDYLKTFNKLLELADYESLRREQAEARKDPTRPLIGIGLGSYLKICGFGPWESATVRVSASGTVKVLSGTSPHGQGHMTTFAQIVSEQLQVPMSHIVVQFNDTAVVATGVGTMGSRSAAVGGSAVFGAAQTVRDKMLRIAAQALEASIDDLELRDGAVRVKGVPDKSIAVKAIAGRAYGARLPEGDEPGLESTRFFSPPGATFPFGMHLAVVEIDRDTGRVRVMRYVAVDDCGRVLNPLILDGQRHGGIAQGIGQALFEGMLYDQDTGQLMTVSFGDYTLPRATDFPVFELASTETPTPLNPLGVKGIGEAGTVGSTPTVLNAVADALEVDDVEMPATAERVWQVLHRARAQ